MDLKEKIKDIPASPGVYIMKGDKDEVLYIGKARNLHKRVASYLYPHRRFGGRIDALMQRVGDVSYIQTTTEAEALIYENSLIKQLSPRYNVALRDDKSYPMLKLTVNEKFPRLFITRQVKKDGSLYYGPYTNVKLLRKALIILRQVFQLRSCGKLSGSLCLNYHIKQCLGPCVGRVDEAGYNKIVAELKLFLEGRKTELLKLLSERMAQEAAKENFEEAARIKDRIEALSVVREKTVGYGARGELEELKDILGIKDALDIIEAFDVSDTMGTSAVGSMICFYKGRPKKSEYRRFKIKTVSKMDDYAMIREIVSRRYSRSLAEKKALPDLILIDGGKAHLLAAMEALKGVGLSDIPVIGIAKEFERIYARNKKEPIALPRQSKALHLLERIRDEAHRFAIAYHKRLLSKKVILSELDNIAGIGEKRKKALLNHFGSVGRIRQASLEEVLKVEGISEKSAKNIVEYFKK